MKFGFSALFLLGVIAALANVLGGLFLFPSNSINYSKKFLRYLVGIGAGFMLAVVFVEILPKTLSLWTEGKPNFEEAVVLPMLLLLGGYLLTQFFEHTIAPHFHLGSEFHSDSMISSKSAYTAIGGLTIHTFFDGVSIAAASSLSFAAGLLVFLAIFLHKLPEGFTVASLLLAAGKSKKEVIWATSLVGLTTLIGILFIALIGERIGFTVLYALPVSAGVTLYVAASDLIPEVNHHGGKNPTISLVVFAGVALFFLLHYLLHAFLET